ncbi:MAG TPA: DUF4403 family protein [Nitrospiraceae bacterium]|nr:DUF4403 family protein [Nitrospiraceae bacterium]
MLLHVELPTAALQPSFDRLYDGHLAGRQGPQEWVALGGGTGFIRYQANRRHSALEVHAKEIRSQATIEFSLDYAKPIAGKVTKTADCGVGAGGSQPGRLAVTISSLLTYQRNYSFEPSSRVTSVDVLHPCLLGPDRVNAAPLMAQVYRSRLESMLPALDRSLRETVSFKAKLSDAWARLHAPIQLDESGTMWLLLSPLHTEGLEPASRNGTVSAEVGVVATPRVVMGRKPVLAARPLPALGSRYTERGFHVPFDLDVPYDEANERLRRGLVGQDFGLGPGRIVVRRVKLYPVGKQAGVDIDVDGLITLGVKLRGTPVYDRTTETIGFANVEYEMADQNALTTFADELLHEAVRDELAARLKIPLKGSLEEMRRELESALNREIEGGTLHGKVDRIRLLDVAVGPSALSVRFRTDGELRYHLR